MSENGPLWPHTATHKSLVDMLLDDGSVTNGVALAAFVLESCLYGVYMTIFLPTTWLIWHTRRDASSKRGLQLVGVTFCTLFFLATTHIVLSLVMLFTNLVDPSNLTDTYQYITDGDRPLSTASTCIWICMVVVADILVVWRCWVIWGNKLWIVIMFSVLELAFIACGIRGAILFEQLNSDVIFDASVIGWYTALNALSFTINVLASFLICLRLYLAARRISRVAGKAHADKYRMLLWTFLESGSLYPAVMVVGLAMYCARTEYGWLTLTIAPQILAIMPTLMVLVVLVNNRSLSQGPESHVTTRSRSLSTGTWQARGTSHGRPPIDPLSPDSTLETGIQVHISKEEFKLADLAVPSEVHVVGMSRSGSSSSRG